MLLSFVSRPISLLRLTHITLFNGNACKSQLHFVLELSPLFCEKLQWRHSYQSHLLLVFPADICLKEVPSIADSVYNIRLLKEFSQEYLNKCFYLRPEDLLYSPPVLKVKRRERNLPPPYCPGLTGRQVVTSPCSTFNRTT